MSVLTSSMRLFIYSVIREKSNKFKLDQKPPKMWIFEAQWVGQMKLWKYVYSVIGLVVTAQDTYAESHNGDTATEAGAAANQQWRM